ncbi:MAG: SLC13 family permease [Flavobacteriales bacterium]
MAERNKKISLLLGPMLFIILWAVNPLGLENAPCRVIAVMAWMLTWWITESVPMAITALLPIVLFPLLGIMSLEKTCLSYSNRSVFLFMGGFIIALAMEKWNLHRRLALGVIKRTGTNANRIIFGFFLATYLISMWISNTATTLMMLPIALSVITLLVKEGDLANNKGMRNFAITIMLSIAYGSSIGGIGTLVGTPPNSSMAATLANDTFNHAVTFFEWMKYAFPFSIALLLLSYFVLVKFIFPNRLGHFEEAKAHIRSEAHALGKWTVTEKRIFIVFVCTAILWIVQDPISAVLKPHGVEFTDTSIAIIAGALLFMIPANKKWTEPILKWKDSEKLHWGILLMFGGGMSLAEGFTSSGLMAKITVMMNSLDKSNLFLFGFILCVAGLFLTALMSNIAMVNIFIPVVATLAIGCGVSPEIYAIPVTIAASCDFMFPMSTPPNAIAYSSGYIKSSEMLKAGLVLNLISLLLLMLLVYIMI